MAHVERSRTYPVDLATAYDVVVAVPLEEVLGRRYLAIPAVSAVEQDRPWGEEVGQRRVLRFSDGGRATEVLELLDAPHRFGYELVDVTGPMRALLRTVHGVWAFEPVGSASSPATRVTWSWDVVATLLGRVLMPGFTRMWRGAADRCLDALSARLTP